MKKWLFVGGLFLLLVILLIVYGKKDKENTEDINPIDLESTVCLKAINKYLDGVDKEGNGEEVKAGDNITVDYIGRLEDGTVFDTTIRSIAEACEIYSEDNDYIQGYSFEVGSAGVIDGFNEGVIGMKIGQTKTVQFGPEKGYGKYDKKLVEVYSKTEIAGDLSQYIQGDTVHFGMGMTAKVINVTDKEVTLDYNHELAGKNLIFDITLKSIN